MKYQKLKGMFTAAKLWRARQALKNEGKVALVYLFFYKLFSFN